MKASSQVHVLVGFADALSAPEVVWSLLAEDCKVSLLAREGNFGVARLIQGVTTYSISAPNDSCWLSSRQLEELIELLTPDYLMPLDDDSVWLFGNARYAKTRVIGPTGRRHEVALDKEAQVHLARKSGFNVPPTVVVHNLDDSVEEVGTPLVLKPVKVVSQKGDCLVRGSVELLKTKPSDAELTQRIADDGPLLAQSCIDGIGVGIFGVCEGGVLRFPSSHKRIRMMNPAGSGSSACEAIEVDPDSLACAERLLSELEWEGLVMVELIRDADGKDWFVELNGRSWGSMALARRSGFEYPAWSVPERLAGLALNNKVIEPNAKPIIARHLGRELVRLAIVSRGAPPGYPYTWPTLSETLREVIGLDMSSYLYNWRWQEPHVFLIDTVMSLLHKTRLNVRVREVAKKIGRRLLAIRCKIASYLNVYDDEFKARLRSCSSILFVCYGNINRSPIAAKLLLAENSCDLRVESSGFHEVVGRRIDENMREIADTHCDDLWAHQSTMISPEFIASFDLVIAMEALQVVWLREKNLENGPPVFLFGAIPGAALPTEIPDPFGKELKVYRSVFSQLVRGVKSISQIRRVRLSGT